MKLLRLKIKPSSFPDKEVYGYVNRPWVRSLFGKTVSGYRDGMNYYNVEGSRIHIYNATELDGVENSEKYFDPELLRIVKLLAEYGEDAWENPIFRDGFKKVNSGLITEARLFCKKNNIKLE